MPRETYNYKRSALRTAKDLLYGAEVLEALAKATTETEISRIMTNARKESK